MIELTMGYGMGYGLWAMTCYGLWATDGPVLCVGLFKAAADLLWWYWGCSPGCDLLPSTRGRNRDREFVYVSAVFDVVGSVTFDLESGCFYILSSSIHPAAAPSFVPPESAFAAVLACPSWAP